MQIVHQSLQPREVPRLEPGYRHVGSVGPNHTNRPRHSLACALGREAYRNHIVRRVRLHVAAGELLVIPRQQRLNLPHDLAQLSSRKPHTAGTVQDDVFGISQEPSAVWALRLRS